MQLNIFSFATSSQNTAIQAADLIGWNGAVDNPRVFAFVRRVCEKLGRPAFAPTDMIEELMHLPAIMPLPDLTSRVFPYQIESQGFSNQSEYDSSSMLEVEASMDGKTLFS